MIHLTRLNHGAIVINAELIEHVEANPDTVVTLINGSKFLVLEDLAEVVERARTYQREIRAALTSSGRGGHAH
jgi:flagellar protein FlbD